MSARWPLVQCCPGDLAKWLRSTTRWPDLAETAQIRHTHVVLAATYFDHDPRNNQLQNLKSLCQRCHMIHDRQRHLAQR